MQAAGAGELAADWMCYDKASCEVGLKDKDFHYHYVQKCSVKDDIQGFVARVGNVTCRLPACFLPVT